MDLAIKISQGLREKIKPSTPEEYVNIFTECWDNEPDNRPTMKQVVDKLSVIITKTNMMTENVQVNSEPNNIEERVFQTNRGFALGQLQVGYFYHNGMGIEKDLKMAIYWFIKAANNGNMIAINNLGLCYHINMEQVLN
ncbi:17108_t:CDS:2 [Funneliformis geosporum]|uniref:17108_t:CDS:1 n=1 Tax=Funneliformis geosporum TaxID=1117311 RepID=A0A9W4SCR9_9GLOM|nr:17108_t:CDS:2 [Funneliformis geosporum]